MSAFNLTKNEIKFKSLTKDYFQQQQLENFNENSKQPHERLYDIFDGKENAKMLTEPFNLRAIIPKKVSILSLLSKTLHHDQQMSTSNKRNMTTIRPYLFHTHKVQVQVKREVHMKNIKENNDNFVIYTYCELLHTTKWDDFIKNLLDDKAKWDFLDEMT